jgi:hypothetical protein
MGLAPGTLVGTNATNQSLALAGPSSKGLTASEDLYRGADTLAYGDNKPSEDAIDRVSSKINQEYVDSVTSAICSAYIPASAKRRERPRTTATSQSPISTNETRSSTRRSRDISTSTQKSAYPCVSSNRLILTKQDSSKFRARHRVVDFLVSFSMSALYRMYHD